MRISARAIIFENENVILMHRIKKQDDGTYNNYYVVPGGGQQNETLEECAIRELKEEMSVDIKVIKYIGKLEDEETSSNFFYCEIVSGNLLLGGEEKEKLSEDNYYEIIKININELDNYNIIGKKMILKSLGR